MPGPGQLQLDFEFLGQAAKTVALDVAAENQLYLGPGALVAVDRMVEERQEVISRSWRDLETWKAHVRHISMAVAGVYRSRGIKRITDPDELLETSRPVYRVYPYD
jgi:hypothetical protein